MRLRNLNEIKKHGDRNPFVLEVYRDSDVRLMIGRCPGIGSEAESAFMLLVHGKSFRYANALVKLTYL